MVDDTMGWRRFLDSDDASPPTLFDTLKSAFGYFLVPVLCSLAGYAVAHKASIPKTVAEWIPLVSLWALLAPAYVGRAALYESTKTKFVTRDDLTAIRWQKKMSWQYGLASFFVVLAGVGAPLARMSRENPVLLLQTLCTIFPIYVLGIFVGIRWPRDRKLFDFRFRNFFPALATCLPPFVFGYEIHGDLMCSVTAALLVLIPWLVAIKLPAKPFAIGGFILLILLILALPFQSVLINTTTPKCIVLCTFGLLLTLAMGVCETFRFTARVLNDAEYRPEGNFSAETKRYYLSGANLATALFLPIFLWTALHPATSMLYLFSAVALLMGQYTAWYLDRTETKRTWWPMAGAVIGYLFPVIVTVGTSIETWPHISHVQQSVTLFDMLGFWGFVLIPMVPLVKYSGLWDLITSTQRLLQFRSFSLCLGATGVTSLLLASTAVGCGFLVSQTVDPPPTIMLSHAMPLAFVYVVIGVVCALMVVGVHYTVPRVPLPPARDDTPGRSESPTLRVVLLIWKTARTPTAGIAGSVPTIALLVNNWPPVAAITAGVAIALATMFGFVVNDILDFDKDRSANRQTPIAMGNLSRRSAWIGAACLATVSICCAHYGNGVVMMCLILVALIFYTPFAHALPMLKGAYTAGLSLSPVLFAVHITSGAVDFYVVGGLALFIVGRELLLDVRDLPGDTYWGLHTMASVLSQRAALVVGVTSMFVGISLATYFTNTAAARMLGVTAAVSLTAIFGLKHLTLDRRLRLSRLTMACGALVVALSVTV